VKRLVLAILCFAVAASAFSDLHVLLGPTALVDRQNEIMGTAVGLNATLWGLVPKRANLGVVGIIDTVLYVHSSNDAYTYDEKRNNFGFNLVHGYGYAFLLSRQIQLETFADAQVYNEEDLEKIFGYGISCTYLYNESFDLVETVDSCGVLPWKKEVDPANPGEIQIRYLPLVRERRLHAGLGLNLNISQIYDLADQMCGGFFIGLGASLISMSYLRPDNYGARVVGITNGVIVTDEIRQLWFSGARSQPL